MSGGTRSEGGPEPRVEWCPLDRLPELQAFLDSHWQRGHVLARDSELLRWQHPRPAEPGRLSVLLAEVDGHLAASLGVIPFELCVTGERLPGAWMTTWVTKPEYRNRQLGLRLLRCPLDGDYGMVGTLGGNDVTQRILGALRFHVRDEVPRWVRVVSAEALERLIGQGHSYPAEAWSAWRASARAGVPTSSPSGVRVVDWSDDAAARWDAAWHERFARRIVGTWRDAGYLRWRYLDHPRFRYTVRLAEDERSGAALGLLVHRVQPVRGGDGSVLRVVELLASAGAGPALATDLLQAAEAARVAFADFYCTSAGFAAPLEEAGFADESALPARLPSLFQPLDFRRTRLTGAFWVTPAVAPESRAFFEDPSLYFTRSDCDQDRPN